MSISLKEQFQAIDWARYANISGQAAAISCIFIALLSALFDLGDVLFVFFGPFVWTLGSGLLIAIWEVPLIYATIPVCVRFKSTCLDELYLRVPIVRTILYTFLSFFIVVGGHVYVMAGLVLLASAVLYAFTAINMQAEASQPWNLQSNNSLLSQA